jgi:hypothetical protein
MPIVLIVDKANGMHVGLCCALELEIQDSASPKYSIYTHHLHQCVIAQKVDLTCIQERNYAIATTLSLASVRHPVLKFYRYQISRRVRGG